MSLLLQAQRAAPQTPPHQAQIPSYPSGFSTPNPQIPSPKVPKANFPPGIHCQEGTGQQRALSTAYIHPSGHCCRQQAVRAPRQCRQQAVRAPSCTYHAACRIHLAIRNALEVAGAAAVVAGAIPDRPERGEQIIDGFKVGGQHRFFPWREKAPLEAAGGAGSGSTQRGTAVSHPQR